MQRGRLVQARLLGGLMRRHGCPFAAALEKDMQGDCQQGKRRVHHEKFGAHSRAIIL
jgi:hypothetical protein